MNFFTIIIEAINLFSKRLNTLLFRGLLILKQECFPLQNFFYTGTVVLIRRWGGKKSKQNKSCSKNRNICLRHLTTDLRPDPGSDKALVHDLSLEALEERPPTLLRVSSPQWGKGPHLGHAPSQVHQHVSQQNAFEGSIRSQQPADT